MRQQAPFLLLQSSADSPLFMIDCVFKHFRSAFFSARLRYRFAFLFFDNLCFFSVPFFMSSLNVITLYFSPHDLKYDWFLLKLLVNLYSSVWFIRNFYTGFFSVHETLSAFFLRTTWSLLLVDFLTVLPLTMIPRITDYHPHSTGSIHIAHLNCLSCSGKVRWPSGAIVLFISSFAITGYFKRIWDN